MFREQPAGKYQIKVCRTLSCAMGGSKELCSHLKKNCGVGEAHGHAPAVSADGRYSVEFVECLADCGRAPVIMINDDFYEGVTPAVADKIMQKYQ
jgi:NADH-quinone oxidoreductase subunit E